MQSVDSLRTDQSDTLSKCCRKREQDMDHRIEPRYEPLIAFTDFVEGFCLLSKYAQDSIRRVAAAEFHRKWVRIEILSRQFLVLFRGGFKD